MDGIITQVYGRYYTVSGKDEEINCTLRGKIKRTPMSKNFSSPAAVGDRVVYEKNDDGENGAINLIQDRTNWFSRRSRVLDKDDIIAANLDVVLVVQSFETPRLNLRYVDRLMVRAARQGISAALCVNKCDLATGDDIDYVKTYYRSTGYPLFFISALDGEGVQQVADHIKGRQALFAGSSGVGKTTLLNQLYPGVDFKTSHVSESTGKGRHTTTNVKLVVLEDGTRIIDTPGMREFGLADIEPHELADYYPDFLEHAGRCKFSPCFHDHEPQCGVIDALEDEIIHEDRYVSYLNILDSLRHEWDTRYQG